MILRAYHGGAFEFCCVHQHLCDCQLRYQGIKLLHIACKKAADVRNALSLQNLKEGR